jgi:hypothetical protein
MNYWLKTLGGGARGTVLRDDWQQELGGVLLRAATFPRCPKGIRAGDGVVYYAAGHRLTFAAGHVSSDAYQAESYERTHWPWRVDVFLSQTVEFVHEGTPLEHLNVSGRDLAQSVRRHAYIRLTKDEYETGVRSLGGEV